jgi:hypothetical protein
MARLAPTAAAVSEAAIATVRGLTLVRAVLRNMRAHSLVTAPHCLRTPRM